MAQGRLTTEHIVLRPGAAQEDEPEGPAPPTSRDLPLLDEAQSDGFLRRWDEVQARFVDDPQGAVQDGDSLVADLLQALTASFVQHKEGLEEQWRSGGEPSTEQLRRALQQYRSFFSRMLAA